MTHTIIISLGNALRREQIKPGYNIYSVVYLHGNWETHTGQLIKNSSSRKYCFQKCSPVQERMVPCAYLLPCKSWPLFKPFMLLPSFHQFPSSLSWVREKTFFWELSSLASQSMGKIFERMISMGVHLHPAVLYDTVKLIGPYFTDAPGESKLRQATTCNLQ